MAETTEFEIPVMWYYDEGGNATNGKVTLAIGDYVNYDCKTSDASYTSEGKKMVMEIKYLQHQNTNMVGEY